jgi:uncharacterized protein (TIGR02270 family)
VEDEPSSQSDLDLVLWDVVEEHLDESEFLLAQWAQAMDSPVQTMATLQSSIERRLLGHLDGLASNSPAVADRILAPLFLQPEAAATDRLVAACLAALALGRFDLIDHALRREDRHLVAAFLRSFELTPTSLESWVHELRNREPGSPARALSLKLAAAAGVAMPNLLLELQSEDPEEAAMAARAARWAPAQLHLPALEYMLTHPDPRVEEEALVACLVHGSRVAFQHCWRRVQDPQRANELSMLLLALFGDARAHAALTALLPSTQHRSAALFALGYSGRADSIPLLLQYAASPEPEVQARAIEALQVLTGWELPTGASEIEREGADGVGEQDAPDTNEAANAPAPGIQALTDWCRTRVGSLDPKQRLLLGEPWTAMQALRALDILPLPRRHAIALWLLVRTGGAIRIDTRTFMRTQKKQMRSAASGEPLAFVRSYSAW